MKVLVKKLSANENTFQSKLEDLEDMPCEPEVGAPLVIYGGYKGGIRTSVVEEVQRFVNGYLVKTANSIYEIILKP